MPSRFRNPWWVVVGSVAGLFVCNGPIVAYTFGVFLKPIMADTGWDRGTASFPMACGEFIGAFAVPLLGWMMDRWSIRSVTLPGIVIFALCLGAMSVAPYSLPVVVAMFVATMIASEVQSPLPYTKALSAWFDRRRGLALGISMAGVGLGAMVVPQLAQMLIVRFGWRGAYACLGLLMLVVAFPAVALWVREPQPGEGEGRSAAVSALLPGVTAREALATVRFWVLGAVFFLVALALLGFSGHIIPLLTDRGLSPAAAAATFGLLGLATLSGRLATGYLVDRFFAPYVAAVFWLAPVAGFALLIGGAGILPAIGVFLVGVGLGAEADLLAFLNSRYFGQRSFGQLYGYFFMCFAMGGACGRFLDGYSFDRAGSYVPALIGSSAALVIAVALLTRLSSYAYPVERGVVRGLAAEAA